MKTILILSLLFLSLSCSDEIVKPKKIVATVLPDGKWQYLDVDGVVKTIKPPACLDGFPSGWCCVSGSQGIPICVPN